MKPVNWERENLVWVSNSWRAYNRAMKYEDMDIVLRTEERNRERERARKIYLSTHPWETIPM
jgi:hypothetical protein